jgi:hypothetical protein
MLKRFFNLKILNIVLLLLVATLCLGATKEYKRIHNLRVKGWLFGDANVWVGKRTFAATAAVDSFYKAGVDSSDFIFVMARGDSAATFPLIAKIWKDDSILVRQPDSLYHDKEYYAYVIIKK